MVRTKVFVGNLSFKTVEAELAQQFSVAGKVISANIITRGPRSLGYGFVEFDSEEEAQKAVKAMNKKEIDGRPINVEIAKPREEGEEKPKPAPTRGRGRGRGRGVFRQRGRGGGASPRGGGSSKPSGEKASPSKKPFYKSEAPAKGEEEEKSPGKPRRRGFRRRRGGAPRKPLSENREESKTTLFVANLPFKFDDAAFGKVFSDLGISYKSAHVVIKRNGLSKGYGFVEFNSEADQKKALGEVNGKVVDGRDLSVKVALTENKPEGEGKQESKAETKEAPKKEEKPAKAETASPKKDSASPKTEKKEETK